MDTNQFYKRSLMLPFPSHNDSCFLICFKKRKNLASFIFRIECPPPPKIPFQPLCSVVVRFLILYPYQFSVFRV
ncbi:hypothetical protein SADUNF_Sadunf15G0033300 [Salix dunnii]|uniref:Uncharacterized protein n=1 Tax=Salix dunnii TaxID=1413687 RepID=A0A835MIW4_9ROSI|nr:hypothetical protein SADUNF_Sadunf15G0033300 [Salix dunnii]